MNQNEEHLRLLALFHYIMGGLTAVLSCIPLIHVAVGIAMLSGAFDGQANPPPPAFLGWIFAGIGGVLVLGGWTMAALMIIAGRRIKLRRSRTFCLVVAGLECLLMPFGTVLGVCTLIVLLREPVRALFLPLPPPQHTEH